MIYSYTCGCNSYERDFPCGQAPKLLERCSHCSEKIRRDFGRDFQTIEFGVDPYRSYALSSQKMQDEATQQRRVGGPQDSTEKRQLESKHGVQFIGNDKSVMTPKAQRGVETYLAKKRAGELA